MAKILFVVSSKQCKICILVGGVWWRFARSQSAGLSNQQRFCIWRQVVTPIKMHDAIRTKVKET